MKNLQVQDFLISRPARLKSCKKLTVLYTNTFYEPNLNIPYNARRVSACQITFNYGREKKSEQVYRGREKKSHNAHRRGFFSRDENKKEAAAAERKKINNAGIHDPDKVRELITARALDRLPSCRAPTRPVFPPPLLLFQRRNNASKL